MGYNEEAKQNLERDKRDKFLEEKIQELKGIGGIVFRRKTLEKDNDKRKISFDESYVKDGILDPEQPYATFLVPEGFKMRESLSDYEALKAKSSLYKGMKKDFSKINAMKEVKDIIPLKKPDQTEINEREKEKEIRKKELEEVKQSLEHD